MYEGNRDTLVGIVSGYRLEGVVRFPEEARYFPELLSV
jgi:hypothetical protein